MNFSQPDINAIGGIIRKADGSPKTRGPSILGRISSWVSGRFRKSDPGLAHDVINPIWNIDARHAEMLHDVARTGNFVMLQYLYNEIEQNDPTLLVCCDRHASAIQELGWSVARIDQRRSRRADKALVDEQIACLEEAMAGIDNLPDALGHLSLASFRGFSHIAPVWSIDGRTVEHFDLLDTWNFCYNRHQQCWMWNPDARPWTAVDSTVGAFGDLKAIPASELVTVTKRRAIDWPALKIYLRMAIGERDWGRFMETYGLPPVILTMPDMATEDEVDKYMKAAEAVFEGRTGVVPNGTQISWASESRGTNPFSEFIDHQQKLIVLMATGGTLTSLSESGSGTLAGGAQMDVWIGIVRAIAKVVGNAVNKQLCEQIIARQPEFRGKPVVAEFKLNTEPPLPAKDLLELAGMASSAGFEMDADELTRKTGFKITKKPDLAGGAFNNAVPMIDHDLVTVTNDGDADGGESVPHVETRENAPEALPSPKATTIAPARANAPTGGESRRRATMELAASLQHDFKVVADRLNAILAMPEDKRRDEAMKLMRELDSLVPGDPEMAEVIAEQMASAFGEQVEDHPEGDRPDADRVVPNAN